MTQPTEQDLALGRAIKEAYPWAVQVRLDSTKAMFAYETETIQGKEGWLWTDRPANEPTARHVFLGGLIRKFWLWDYVTEILPDWETWGLDLSGDEVKRLD
jgi:hypothetical protein